MRRLLFFFLFLTLQLCSAQSIDRYENDNFKIILKNNKSNSKSNHLQSQETKPGVGSHSPIMDSDRVRAVSGRSNK